jgi:hypothetical protein
MSADGGKRYGLLRIRFPDGEVELRWTDNELPVGVLVRSRGVLWRVRSNDHGGAILLEPASGQDGADRGPVVKPTPLGDEPILLEMVVEG